MAGAARRAVLALPVLLLCALAPAAPAGITVVEVDGCYPAPVLPDPLGLTEPEIRLFALVAFERDGRETFPLFPDPQLQALARWKASQLAAHDALSHSLPDGSGFGDHLARFGLVNIYAGENISVAEHWLGATVEVNHAKFVASPGHLENMLRPEMTHVGMASAVGASGLYTVQVYAALPLR